MIKWLPLCPLTPRGPKNGWDTSLPSMLPRPLCPSHAHARHSLCDTAGPHTPQRGTLTSSPANTWLARKHYTQWPSVLPSLPGPYLSPHHSQCSPPTHPRPALPL